MVSLLKWSLSGSSTLSVRGIWRLRAQSARALICDRRDAIGSHADGEGHALKLSRVFRRGYLVEHDGLTEVEVDFAHGLTQAAQIAEEPAKALRPLGGAGLLGRVVAHVTDHVVADRDRDDMQIAGAGGVGGVHHVFEEAVAWRHELADA